MNGRKLNDDIYVVIKPKYKNSSPNVKAQASVSYQGRNYGCCQIIQQPKQKAYVVVRQWTQWKPGKWKIELPELPAVDMLTIKQAVLKAYYRPAQKKPTVNKLRREYQSNPSFTPTIQEFDHGWTCQCASCQLGR